MPTTVVSLLIFVALTVPGLLHYIQRRRLADQPQFSALVEAGTLATVSLVTDGFGVLVFSLLRIWIPSHSPDVDRLIEQGWQYAAPRIGYLVLWGFGFVAVSSALAILWAVKPGPLSKIPFDLVPDFADTTAWTYQFRTAPPKSSTYVGCDLADGTFVSGLLAWYSTSLDEDSERGLILAEPLSVVKDGKQVKSEFQRIVLSAKDIKAIYVSYVTQEALAK